MELLVVVAIVLAMASLLLLLVPKKPAEIKRTELIIAAVQTALGMTEANRGSAMSPTEHPFAGSQAEAGGQRFAFVRSDPRWPGAVARSGTALKGVPSPEYLSADLNHLLMASDRFADQAVPLLFGARREDLGVLQSQRKVVTKYRQLPMPSATTSGRPGKVLSPRTGLPATSGYQGDDHPDFPDTLVPSRAQLADPTYGVLADSKATLDYLFGSSNMQSDLASLKALYNADPSLPEDVNRFRDPVEARVLGATREPLVFTNTSATAQQTPDGQSPSESSWKPGRISVKRQGAGWQVGNTTGGTWVRYRLAGLAVYDAWGVELLTSKASGSYRIISAGADGVLAVAPGTDKTIDTDLVGDLQDRLPLSDQDQDGAKDNLP
jgi:type II secretory pathway pseudopilin PulG